MQSSGNLEAIHIIKKTGGTLQESFLDEGFILDKKIGVGQPKRIENARILVANTPMDTDKIKIYGARVRVDSMAKVRIYVPSEVSATYASSEGLGNALGGIHYSYSRIVLWESISFTASWKAAEYVIVHGFKGKQQWACFYTSFQ